MVHDLAPTPERVVGGTAAFGEPGHAALEGVAMEVGKTGNGDAGDVISAGAGRAFGDRGDSAVGNGDPNVARPAGWQQTVIKKEFASQIAFSAPVSICRGPILRDNRRPCAKKYRNLTDLLDPVMTPCGSTRFGSMRALQPSCPASRSSVSLSAVPSRPRTDGSPLLARPPTFQPAGTRGIASPSTALGHA